MSSDEERCQAVALRILAYRWNSAHELDVKLRRRNFESEVIASTLKILESAGWVDDRRFAEAAVREGSRKSLGRRRIESQLAGAGIDRELSQQVVGALISRDEEQTRMEDACRKRMRIMLRRSPDALSTDQGRNKLIEYLLKQGYEYAAAAETVARLSKEFH